MPARLRRGPRPERCDSPSPPAPRSPPRPPQGDPERGPFPAHPQGLVRNVQGRAEISPPSGRGLPALPRPVTPQEPRVGDGPALHPARWAPPGPPARPGGAPASGDRGPARRAKPAGPGEPRAAARPPRGAFPNAGCFPLRPAPPPRLRAGSGLPDRNRQCPEPASGGKTPVLAPWPPTRDVGLGPERSAGRPTPSRRESSLRSAGLGARERTRFPKSEASTPPSRQVRGAPAARPRD